MGGVEVTVKSLGVFSSKLPLEKDESVSPSPRRRNRSATGISFGAAGENRGLQEGIAALDRIDGMEADRDPGWQRGNFAKMCDYDNVGNLCNFNRFW